MQAGLTALDFLYHMTDEDLYEVIEMGDIERFCNALTLDFAELESGLIKNQC